MSLLKTIQEFLLFDSFLKVLVCLSVKYLFYAIICFGHKKIKEDNLPTCDRFQFYSRKYESIFLVT